MAESTTGSDYEVEESDGDVWTFITVLSKGTTFEYVVPNFPVICAKLTEVKLQWVNCGGDLEVFDGFTRDCAALDHTLPATLKISFSYDHAFIIEVCYISCYNYMDITV